MVNLSKIIWIGVGILGTYVIITKTNFLGDFVGYIQKKSPMKSMATQAQTLPQPLFQTPQSQPGSTTSTTIPDQTLIPQPQTVQPTAPTPTLPQPQPQPQPGTVGQNPNTTTGRNVKNTKAVAPRVSNNIPQTAQPSTVVSPPAGTHLFDLTKPGGASKPGSIRIQGKSNNLPPNQSYGIHSKTGIVTHSGGMGYSPGLEITSAGPGSNDGKCCGITIGVSAESGKTNGKAFISTEDWSTKEIQKAGKHTFFCGGKGHGPQGNMTPDCTDSSGMVQNINVRNTTIPLSWHCDQKTSPGNIIYCGRLDGKTGCGPGYFAAVMNPTDLKGRRILPNRLGNDPDELGADNKTADDQSRIRADDLGTPDFGMPYAIAE